MQDDLFSGINIVSSCSLSYVHWNCHNRMISLYQYLITQTVWSTSNHHSVFCVNILTTFHILHENN